MIYLFSSKNFFATMQARVVIFGMHFGADLLSSIKNQLFPCLFSSVYTQFSFSPFHDAIFGMAVTATFKTKCS